MAELFFFMYSLFFCHIINPITFLTPLIIVCGCIVFLIIYCTNYSCYYQYINYICNFQICLVRVHHCLCWVVFVSSCFSFLVELEKMDTSRLMEEPRYMDSLKAEASWSTPKEVYTLVSGMKVWRSETDNIWLKTSIKKIKTLYFPLTVTKKKLL